MAGSKIRTNIHGHIVVAEPEQISELRRWSTSLLGRIFRIAQEQGQIDIELSGQHFELYRHPDHTFTIESPGKHRFVV